MSGAPARHAVLSLLFAAGLLGVLAVAFDVGGSARRALPAVTVAGLDQDWRLFAPDPPRSGLRLEALTTWSDGARTIWRMPTGGALIGAYSDYRWRKWAEHAGADSPGRALWRPMVRYVAARLPRRPGATPIEVAIVRRTRALARPGGDRPWSTLLIYRARVAAERP
jgi:hypothetical protein